MKIDDLLNKYVEGYTTCEEEREIKRFFREECVPPELEVYRPLFAFFEKEAKTYASRAAYAETKRPKRRFIYALTGIAAGLLIILGIAGITQANKPDNYIIIDGRKSTDIQLARQQAQAAIHEVSFSREEIFETLFSE